MLRGSYQETDDLRRWWGRNYLFEPVAQVKPWSVSNPSFAENMARNVTIEATRKAMASSEMAASSPLFMD
jgi:hypothetical protein